MCSAIVLRAEIADQHKYDLGNVVIGAILCIMICAFIMGILAVLLVVKEIERDERKVLKGILKLKCAVKRIESYKRSQEIRKKHIISSVARTEKIHLLQSRSQKRLSKRLRDRHIKRAQRKMMTVEKIIHCKQGQGQEKLKATRLETGKKEMKMEQNVEKDVPFSNAENVIGDLGS